MLSLPKSQLTVCFYVVISVCVYHIIIPVYHTNLFFLYYHNLSILTCIFCFHVLYVIILNMFLCNSHAYHRIPLFHHFVHFYNYSFSPLCLFRIKCMTMFYLSLVNKQYLQLNNKGDGFFFFFNFFGQVGAKRESYPFDVCICCWPFNCQLLFILFTFLL